MSMATLERAILASAKTLLKNPKLKMSDIMEWSTSEEQVRGNLATGEKCYFVPDPGVCIAVKADLDKSGK
jgi:hypothetical protein